MIERRGEIDRQAAGSLGATVPILGLLVAAGLVLTGCENPLDVENPNNVAEEDLNSAAAVNPAVNGALRTTTDAWGWTLAIHATATDEVTWIGSRDAWNQLDLGNITGRANEFTDVAFPQLAEAVFMTRKAVEVAERFQGELPRPVNLARAYFFAGLSHTILAENYEDYAFPDEPTESAPPVGEENMDQVFDMAIQFASDAIDAAAQVGASGLVTRSYALRARAGFQKAVWEKLNPPGETPDEPLVSDPDVVSDAQEVLNRVGTTEDWTYNLQYTSQTGTNTLGAWMHDRLEMRHASKFAETATPDPFALEGVIEDPITGEADPHMEELLTNWLDRQQFVDAAALSAREMHLILAEASLAEGDTAGLETHVNHVRTMDGLPAYQSEASEHPEPMEMLRFERMTDLHLTGRRIQDLYRFGERAEKWQDVSAAASEPGTVFPVTITECRANTEFNCD